MSTPLGVGLIGAGAVAQAIHLPTLARLNGLFAVRRVFDVVPEVAEKVAARVGANWSTVLDDVLRDDSVDVVAICSPGFLHAEHVIAACRAAKLGVLCEKPFAETAEEAERITAVAKETGVPILVGAMHTFDPGWRAAAEQWGDLPASAHRILSSIVLPPNALFEDFATEVINRPDGGWTDLHDAEAQAQALHGCIMGLTIHNLPLIRSLLPRFDDVEILEARFLNPMGYEIVLTAGGKIIELHAQQNYTWRPSWSLDVIADDQWLRTEFPPSYVQAGSAVSVIQRPGRALTIGPFPANGYEAEWRELADIVRGERLAPELQPLIDDLAFAIDIADQVAGRIRTTSEVYA